MKSNNFSYSKLDTYQSCSFKYYLRYELENFLFSDSAATEVGTAIHKAEEQIATQIQKKQTINYTEIKMR